jgi:hypothetical protein
MKALKILVFPVLLFCSTIALGMSDKTKEAIEIAPVLVVALDNSGSSPATDPKMMERAWPVIKEKIQALPIFGSVKVMTVGDASQYYLAKSWRIQYKQSEAGDTMDSILSQMEGIVLNFAKQTQQGTVPTHGRTEIVGGFNDIARLLNPKAQQNSVVMVSDLIENSNHADCYRNKTCKLPKPTFSLANTDITVLGVGLSLPANEAMALSASWTHFLKESGANITPASLVRVF